MPGQSLNRNATNNVLVNFGATAGAYSSGQVIGTPQKLIGSLDKGGTATLVAALLLDLAAQKLAVDVYFFNQLPTSMGADKAAFALNTTEALYIVGRYSFLTTSYSVASSNNVSEATVGLLNIGLVSGNGNPVGSGTQVAKSNPNNTLNTNNIYVLAVARGAPTYGANGLYGRFSIAFD
jgi:hypothetical protein